MVGEGGGAGMGSEHREQIAAAIGIQSQLKMSS